MTQAADSNYSINPWMRPEVRPGDNIDPSPYMWPESAVEELLSLSPVPPPAGYTPRLGYPTGELGIRDVLSIAPVGGSAKPGEVGPQGSMRNSIGI